jgi:hypothetical protein
MPFLKEGEIRRWKKCSKHLKELDRNVGETEVDHGKCRARYCDVAKTTCGIRQSNYLPLLLYRIPLRESLERVG